MASDYTIETQCPVCQTKNNVVVPLADYLSWHTGRKLVQAAFPYLNADERELLMTGICKQCWDTQLGEFGVSNYPDGSQEQYDSWDEE